MAISALTVADSISKFTYSTGIQVWDLDEMKNAVGNRDCTVVMPAPNWFSVTEVARVNLGTTTSAKWDLTYVLTYRLFYKKVGTERESISAVMPGLVTDTMLFLDAIFANDSLTGAIDLELAGTPTFGPVEDPIGEMFWGADIELQILEHI